jgi:hypothetical protein
MYNGWMHGAARCSGYPSDWSCVWTGAGSDASPRILSARHRRTCASPPAPPPAASPGRGRCRIFRRAWAALVPGRMLAPGLTAGRVPPLNPSGFAPGTFGRSESVPIHPRAALASCGLPQRYSCTLQWGRAAPSLWGPAAQVPSLWGPAARVAGARPWCHHQGPAPRGVRCAGSLGVASREPKDCSIPLSPCYSSCSREPCRHFKFSRKTADSVAASSRAEPFSQPSRQSTPAVTAGAHGRNLRPTVSCKRGTDGLEMRSSSSLAGLGPTGRINGPGALTAGY